MGDCNLPLSVVGFPDDCEKGESATDDPSETIRKWARHPRGNGCAQNLINFPFYGNIVSLDVVNCFP